MEPALREKVGVDVIVSASAFQDEVVEAHTNERSTCSEAASGNSFEKEREAT